MCWSGYAAPLGRGIKGEGDNEIPKRVRNDDGWSGKCHCDDIKFYAETN